ncbi:unnamed protein product, partial [Didymodactylos carnosus]
YRIVRKVRRVNPNDSPPPRHRSPSVINPRLVQVHVSPNSHRQSSPTSAVPKPRKTIPPHETQRPTYYVPEHAVKQAYNIGSTRLVNKYLIERSDFKQVILWTCLSCCDNQCFDEKCGGNTTIIDIKIGNNSNSTMTNRTSTPNLITATIQDTTTSSSEDPDFIDQHRFAQTVVELLLDLLQKANLSANLIQNETEIAVTTTATPKISKLKLL